MCVVAVHNKRPTFSIYSLNFCLSVDQLFMIFHPDVLLVFLLIEYLFIYLKTGATKDIGTVLTRICLRHKAVEARLKTFTRYIY